MRSNLPRRFWVEICLAVITGVLALITPIWPDWIEFLSGRRPGNSTRWIGRAADCGWTVSYFRGDIRAGRCRLAENRGVEVGVAPSPNAAAGSAPLGSSLFMKSVSRSPQGTRRCLTGCWKSRAERVAGVCSSRMIP